MSPVQRPLAILLAALIVLVIVLLVACRGAGVDASPYVEYERRVASSHGEGVRLGLSFSPAPEKPPWDRLQLVPQPEPAPAPPSLGEGLLPFLCPVCLRSDPVATGSDRPDPAGSGLTNEGAPESQGNDADDASDASASRGSDQELTVETPWGPVTFTLGSILLAVLVVLYGQKKGWIPIPTPPTKQEPEA